MAVQESEYAIVSVAELVDHMSGPTLRTDQQRDAARLLIGLQRGLERYCNRRFMAITVTEEATLVDRRGYAPLRYTPVTAVTSVVDTSTGLPADPTYAYRVVAGGLETTLLEGTLLHVTYTGGYLLLDDADLEDVRLAILDKARDAMADNHDDAVTTKGLEVRQPQDRRRPGGDQPQWTDAELRQFDRLRRRVIA